MNSKCEEITEVFKSAAHWIYRKIKENLINEKCYCNCCQKKKN